MSATALTGWTSSAGAGAGGAEPAPLAAESAAQPVQSVDWLAIAPPTVVAVAAVVVLVTDLFLERRKKHLLGWVAMAGLALAALSLLPLVGADRSTFCLTRGTEACSYVADPFTLAVQLLVLGGALVCALLSLTAPREDGLPPGEFWFLLLGSAAGAALLPAARDLATLVVALEVASLPVFALAGLRRGDRRSSEAALKFFLSSVTATAVTLLGVSFVYASTGALHLTAVAEALPSVEGELGTLAATGVALTLVGFAFKTAAVPFHFWAPETYVGAPLPVAAYLSVIGKAVGFTGLILVTVLAFPAYGTIWGPALAVLAALTMTAGNLAAIRQRADRPRGAVRLLAWSSIGQAGYLLVPMAAAAYGGSDGPLSEDAPVGATVAYALMYAVVNLGAFAVARAVAQGSADNRLDDYRGLYRRSPLTALALAFFLLCLAGLPPGVIGLFAKVTVLRVAVDSGLGWLAVVMAVNVVIGLYYYLRWTALLFSPAPAGPAARHGARPAPSAPAEGAADAGDARHGGRPGELGRPPASLTATVGLTAALALVLSAAPQLILHFGSASLF